MKQNQLIEIGIVEMLCKSVYSEKITNIILFEIIELFIALLIGGNVTAQNYIF